MIAIDIAPSQALGIGTKEDAVVSSWSHAI